MSRGDTLEDTLRLYDRAVYNLLSTLRVDYGNVPGVGPLPTKSILRVWAAPHLAVAKMKKLLVRKKWLNKEVLKEHEEDWLQLPLPFVSMMRQDIEKDLTRQRANFTFRCFRETDDKLGVYQHRFPDPINIVYELDFKSINTKSQNHIREWILSVFGVQGLANTEGRLIVNHDVFGEIITPIHLDSLTDNSDLEQQDFDNRFYRTTLTFTLNGWMFQRAIGQDQGDADGVPVKKMLYGSVSFCDTKGVDGINKKTPTLLGSPSLTSRNLFEDSLGGPRQIQFDYTHTNGATVAASECSCDGRYTPMNPPQSHEKNIPIDLTLATTNDYVRTVPFTAPDNEPIVLRFTAHMETGSGDLIYRIRNQAGDLLLEKTVTFTKRGWYRVERFFRTRAGDRGFSIEWASTGAGDSFTIDKREAYYLSQQLGDTELATDGDMEAAGTGAWTPAGGATLSKETDAEGNQFLRATADAGDGVFQDITGVVDTKVYLVCCSLLQTSLEWTMIVSNAVLLPDHTESDSLPVGQRNSCLFIQPKSGATDIQIRWESSGAGGILDLDDVSVRELKSPIKGSESP